MSKAEPNYKEVYVNAMLNALVILGGDAGTKEILEWIKCNEPICKGLKFTINLLAAQKILIGAGCITLSEDRLAITDKGVVGLTRDEIVSLVTAYEIEAKARLEEHKRVESARKAALAIEEARIMREAKEKRLSDMLARQSEIQNQRSEHSVTAALQDSLCAVVGHSQSVVLRGDTGECNYARCSRCARLFVEHWVDDFKWYWRELVVAPKSEDN